MKKYFEFILIFILTLSIGYSFEINTQKENFLLFNETTILDKLDSLKSSNGIKNISSNKYFIVFEDEGLYFQKKKLEKEYSNNNNNNNLNFNNSILSYKIINNKNSEVENSKNSDNINNIKNFQEDLSLLKNIHKNNFENKKEVVLNKINNLNNKEFKISNSYNNIKLDDKIIKKEFGNIFSGILIEIKDDLLLEELKLLPEVKGIYKEEIYEIQVSNLTREFLEIDKIWEMQYLGENITGKGINIAVLDTGYDIAHPDFNNCENFENCTKLIDYYDFGLDSEFPFDIDGHGTHVASTIASDNPNSNFKGIAPDSKLLLYNVFFETPSGVSASSSTLLSALERALDPNQDGSFNNSADIISMSLGSLTGNSNDLLSLKVDELSESGVTFVIAAGNSGASGFFTIGSPGSSREAITVGASFKNDEFYGSFFGNIDDLAPFSSVGPTNIGLIKPDIIAPGVNICAARASGFLQSSQTCGSEEHVLLSGTSMATPIVSGIVALLKQKNPSWTNKEIKASLKASAIDINELVFKQGWGRVSPFEVLNFENPACIVEFDTRNFTNFLYLNNSDNLDVNAFINCHNYSHFSLNLTYISNFGEKSFSFEILNSSDLQNYNPQNLSFSLNLSEFGNEYIGLLELHAFDNNQTYNNYDMFFYVYESGETNFNLNSCSSFGIGGNYTLSNNVTFSTEYCFQFYSDNLNLDCQGNSIIYSGDNNSINYGIFVQGRNLTINNCNFYNMHYPLFLLGVEESKFSNLSFYNSHSSSFLLETNNNSFSNLNFYNTTNSFLFESSSNNNISYSKFYNIYLSKDNLNKLNFTSDSLNNSLFNNFFYNQSQFIFTNQNNAIFDKYLENYSKIGNFWNLSCENLNITNQKIRCSQPSQINISNEFNITQEVFQIKLLNRSISYINNSNLDNLEINKLLFPINISFYFLYETYFYNLTKNISFNKVEYKVETSNLNNSNQTQESYLIDISESFNLNNSILDTNLDLLNYNISNITLLFYLNNSLFNQSILNISIPVNNLSYVYENISNQIIGNKTNIISNFNNISILINNQSNITQEFSNLSKISLLANNKTLIEFENNFSKTSLDLRKLRVIQDNRENISKLLVDGIELETNKTKTIYFDLGNLSSKFRSICITDRKIFNFEQVDLNCLSENQTFVNSLNFNNGIYNISLVENSSIIKISGLKNSAINQMCTENWSFENSQWSSCSSSSQFLQAIDLNSCGTEFLKPENQIRTCVSSSSSGGGGGGGGGGSSSSSSSSSPVTSTSIVTSTIQENQIKENTTQIEDNSNKDENITVTNLNNNDFFNKQEEVKVSIKEKISNLIFDEDKVNITINYINNTVNNNLENNFSNHIFNIEISKEEEYSISFDSNLDKLKTFENISFISDNKLNKSNLIIKGFSNKNISKSVQIKPILNSNTLCIKDSEISSLIEISNDCSLEDEYLIYCDGSSNYKFRCLIESDFYSIYGLNNTAIIEVDSINQSLKNLTDDKKDENFQGKIFLISISLLFLILIFLLFYFLKNKSFINNYREKKQQIIHVREYIKKYKKDYSKDSIKQSLLLSGIDEKIIDSELIKIKK